ncbi:MAG: Dabb family protein [Pseudomonadota bacterium]
MIKHIVMWKVRGDDPAMRGRNLALLKAEFESLRGCIPGLLQLEVGIDESRIDYAFDVVLVTEFESREALAAYAEHPEHLRVRRALGDMRSARHQVDYEVTAEVAGTDRDRSPPPAGATAGQPPTGDTHHVQTL